MEKNILKLREELDLELTTWTGKTKKDFLKLVKTRGVNAITEKDVFQTLVEPFIDKKDVFLDNDEYQTVLIELKKLSIKNEVVFKINCEAPACDCTYEVDTDLDAVRTYQPSKFPMSFDDKVQVTFRNIPTQEMFDKVLEKYPEEDAVYLQLLMSIEELENKKSESVEQLIEDIDNLPLDKYLVLQELFLENRSRIKLGLDIECPECKIVKNYSFDIIPGFFDDLTKR